MPKKRTSVKRQPRPIFHIYCEGEKTEPNYIDHYIKEHCHSFRQIQLRRIKLNDVLKVAKTNKTDPNSLVELAIGEKARTPSGDEFWCVYDREAENTIPNEIHAKAYAAAAQNGINIALSNVCFEVWLLLHKQPTCAQYASFEDLKKRSKLNAYYKNYAKGNNQSFKDEEIAIARRNAPRMNTSTRKNLGKDGPAYCLNPYSDFYCLLDAIDSFFADNVANNLCR